MRRASAIAGAILLLAGCGEADPIRSPQGSPPSLPADFTIRGRWADPHLTWFADAKNAPIDAEAFRRAVARAAELWTATGLVSLRATDDPGKADVVLSWRRGHHGACLPFGPEADVAHSGPVAPGTFVHFDLGRRWSENGERGVSVFHTALHELGHILGLGHCTADDAVMGTSPRRPGALSPHDLAGLRSLYGVGAGEPGDLLLEAASGARAVLRRVAPEGTTDFAVFDCDGDGRGEVLVWRTDPAGHGKLIAYHLSSTFRLEATSGPWPGMVAPEATVSFAASPAGPRFLVVTFDNGRRVVRQFDPHGVPSRLREMPTPDVLASAASKRAGDLDGDGAADAVTR